MTKCSKCKTKITKQLWIVDGVIFCGPRCERYDWNPRKSKWESTNRYNDKAVEKFGVAGFVREHRVKR